MRFARHSSRAFIVIVAFPLAAGCEQQAGNGQTQVQANGPAMAAPLPENGVNTYAGAIDRRNWRTANIATCSWGAQRRATQGAGTNPAGANFQPYCTCFIDRIIANVETTQLESLQFGARDQAIAAQCARESGLRPDPRIIEDVGGPFPDR